MNRLIVITGGTSGIGSQLKNLFEKDGDKVITFSLEDNKQPNHYFGSVDHEMKVKQVFNDIYEKHGNIDILINCAGIGMSGITELVSTDQIRKVTDVNFFGTLFCIRKALPYMKQGSKIINMSSAMALFPVPFRSIYGAVKSAVLSLSFSLRMELSPLGVDVIAFCPGDTKTNFTKNRIKDFETNERYGDRIKNATLRSDAKENKRMSCDFVSKEIFKLINKKKSKPFYIIGSKYKLLYFLTRLTPKATLLNSTAKVYDRAPSKKDLKTIEKEKILAKIEEDKIKQNEINNTLKINECMSEEIIETPNDTKVKRKEEKSINEEERKKNIEKLLSRIQIINKDENDE